MSEIIDLSLLPEPQLIEKLDFETLFEARKKHFLGLFSPEEQTEVAKTLALDSEPIVKLLQENAYLEMQLRQRVNEAALANMLAFATGSDLDQLGANFDEKRLIIQEADDDAFPPVEEIVESDTAFRARIQQAFNKLSVAGPRSAYEVFARRADGRVSDVSAMSPAPAYVTVSILSRENDGVATEDLLNVVRVALNDEEVRPVADRLTVQSAKIIKYGIKATLFYFPGPAQEPIRLSAVKRLENYVTEQHRIGRDINRSAIMAALHVEGVQRVELHEPAQDIVIDGYSASFCTQTEILSGGYDE